MITGAQMRGARGLLNMSVADLCERTGLAINTVRRAEATNGIPVMTPANMRLIVTMLEDAGVLFIEADDCGPGVRLRSPEPLPVSSRRRPSAK